VGCWHQLVDDCKGFLNSPEAERAAELGWDAIGLAVIAMPVPASFWCDSPDAARKPPRIICAFAF